MKIANRCSGKPASLASSTMARWTSQWTPRQSGTNRPWDELSSPGTSQSWQAQQGPSRGGEVNNQHQWRPPNYQSPKEAGEPNKGPVEGGVKEVKLNTRAGGALEGMEEKRRTHDSFSNIETSFSYFQLSLSWLMYFSVMTLIVYDIVFELLTRSLGLHSASTNKSFNLYYFRFLAVKTQIQHQNKRWSLYDHMSGWNQTSFDQLFITTCFMWLLTTTILRQTNDGHK